MANNEWTIDSGSTSCSIDFVFARFYDGTACLELPNFPGMGIAAALLEVTPVIDALVSAGFELCDPATGESLTRSREETLLAAYEHRQATVEHVVQLTKR